MSELLGRAPLVTGITQAADIIVSILAALRKRGDVIRHGRRGGDASVFAITTQRLLRQATLANLDGSPASQAGRAVR